MKKGWKRTETRVLLEGRKIWITLFKLSYERLDRITFFDKDNQPIVVITKKKK
jgi:hypothetical protein